MRKSHLTFITILLTIISIVLMAPSVCADCGPKPSVDLYIENPPEGEYYVDLLVYYPDTAKTSPKSNSMEDIILSYNEDGWVSRKGGIMDDITNKSNEDHFYRFTYNVPSNFKIIIVTEKLDIIVSDEITPRSYNCVITFDVEKHLNDKKAVSEDLSDTVTNTLRMFAITFSITLVFEAIVFCCFRIKLNKKGKGAFILTNLITQIFLYVFILILPLLYIPAEIVIPFLEIRMMKKHMTEIKKSRRIACLITSNIVSFIFGTPVLIIFIALHLI
ncbi:MAG: hypothetical protein E7500_04460 [Ruminococcus sp.]|nr:hypothetical protein [Ruminococcus sp.]